MSEAEQLEGHLISLATEVFEHQWSALGYERDMSQLPTCELQDDRQECWKVTFPALPVGAMPGDEQRLITFIIRKQKGQYVVIISSMNHRGHSEAINPHWVEQVIVRMLEIHNQAPPSERIPRPCQGLKELVEKHGMPWVVEMITRDGGFLPLNNAELILYWRHAQGGRLEMWVNGADVGLYPISVPLFREAIMMEGFAAQQTMKPNPA
jgi:hypothetical protein